MSIEELNNLISSLIIDNNTGQINPLKLRSVFFAVTSAITQTNLAEVTANAPLNYDPFFNLFTIIKADDENGGYLSSDDWNFFNSVPGRATAVSFKFIQKGFGNSNLAINEIGDIFCGWSNDGTKRIHEATWNGGALTDSDNFTPLIQTEI